jgi:hypothetical protein
VADDKQELPKTEGTKLSYSNSIGRNKWANMKTLQNLLSFSDEALLATILSYCDASDFIQILEIQNHTLIKAAQLAISTFDSLHLSFLQQLDRCRNLGSGKGHNDQEICVSKLLNSISTTTSSQNTIAGAPGKLRRIEFSGLRHIVGDQGNWLSRVLGTDICHSLVSIDFSGCAMLDPRLVHKTLVQHQPSHISSSILHLNFKGCYRIDAGIIMAIAKLPRFRSLQSLGLAGCSQTIADDCLRAILKNLRQLHSLDLSGLKRITDAASSLFLALPETIENLELASCELLRFSWLGPWGMSLLRQIQQTTSGDDDDDDRQRSTTRRIDMSRLPLDYWREVETENNNKKSPPLKNWIKINFSGIGTPRRGLVEGALPYFALRSTGTLREVHLSGCEQVQDWEIHILASSCAKSLTCIEMRACCIGDDAVKALGLYCTNLSDVDFSACFQITDEGVVAFCQYQGIYDDLQNRTHCLRGSSTIRSLKVAAIPRLTNDSIVAISALESLIVLDVHNCPNVTSETVTETLAQLTSLVEVDARGIGKWNSSIAALGCYDREPKRLRFVNGRPCTHSNDVTTSSNNPTNPHNKENASLWQCSVRRHSRRLQLSQGVPLQIMYHCVDCKLIPMLNRGMCHACSLQCHKGHKTFVGSFTRFYCDCPFGIAGSQCICQSFLSRRTIGSKLHLENETICGELS